MVLLYCGVKMLIDENGIPCIVQKISYHIAIDAYKVYYFDGNVALLFADRFKNHYQVRHAYYEWNIVDYSPLIPELETFWFSCRDDPIMWKEFG